MTDKLNNEEIARVFAMYWGRPIFKHLSWAKESTPYWNERILSSCEGWYMLLKPLSAISDEDAIEVAKIRGYNQKDYIENKAVEAMVERGKVYIDRLLNNKYISDSYLQAISCYQYLIQQSYGVPLFFGVNHWANGKTAIELGIAIEQK